MNDQDDHPIKDAGADPAIEDDAAYTPSRERETEELQEDPEGSPAHEQDEAAEEVPVLPGTGGPDDAGATGDDDLDLSDVIDRGREP